MKVTNISTGPRGAYLKGALVMAERGETIEADDYLEEWFEPTGAVASEDQDDDYGSMSDDELRALIEERTGKKPHPNAKRETLIERAREA